MIVIQTALPVEQEAVLEHLTDVRVHRHPAGTLFDVGTIAGHPGRQVAVGVTGPGTLAAAALTERAIAEFSPAAVIFAGIAGGLRPWLEIGDVVVATKVYAYQGGRSEDSEFLVRPRSWEISHELEQVARRLQRGRAWHVASGEPHAPEVYFEAVAAGDVVLNSTSSPVADSLRRNYNDAVAVEMESAGFALAGHLSGRVPTATVRAISDHADGSKTTTDSRGGQHVAARNAAAFAIALAAAIHDDDDEGGGGNRSGGSEPEPPPVHNQNIAHAGANVGQQIGVNTGAFHQTWTREGR